MEETEKLPEPSTSSQHQHKFEQELLEINESLLKKTPNTRTEEPLQRQTEESSKEQNEDVPQIQKEELPQEQIEEEQDQTEEESPQDLTEESSHDHTEEPFQYQTEEPPQYEREETSIPAIHEVYIKSEGTETIATPSTSSQGEPPIIPKKVAITVSVDEQSGGIIHFFHHPKKPRMGKSKKKRLPTSDVTSADQLHPVKRFKKLIRKKPKRIETPIELPAPSIEIPPEVSDIAPDEEVDFENKNRELVNFINMGIKQDELVRIDLTMDLISVAIDEIALEGLDGITIEGLWQRMSVALQYPLPFNKKVENFVWDGIRNMHHLQFYKLEEARPNLIIFNRFIYSNPETGHITDYENAPPDIYPYVPINDKPNNIMGSCSTYYTRKDVCTLVRNLKLRDAVERFGNTLVIVANQKLRNSALIPNVTNPMLPFTEQQYCILERIGRSRRMGELTCGTQSLQIICKDSKTLFYYRKLLLKNMLISKQTFCFKSKLHQNMMGILFHLQRFHNERKSRKQLMIEQIVKLLKTRPKYRMEYIELRTILGRDNWDKLSMVKLIKSQEFKNLVRTDINLDYREIYPNASVAEWKTKSNKERLIRVLELINPDVNLNSLWKDEDPNDSSSDDEIIGDMILNVSLLKQSYDLVLQYGRVGLSLKQFQAQLGLDYYSARSLLRKLTRQDLLESCMVDEGRLRFAKYTAKCLNDDSVHEQFLEEKARLYMPIEHEDDDDETLDFIAHILEIDRNDLKPSPKPEENLEKKDASENILKGKYRELDELRYLIRNNKIKSEEPIDMNHKLLLQEIYKNEHGYFDFDTSLEAQIVTPNKSEKVQLSDSFRNVCAGIFNCNDDVEANDRMLRSAKVNQTEIRRWQELVKNKPMTVLVSKKIRKFAPVLNRFYYKQPNVLAKSYKMYYQKLKLMLASIRSDVIKKRDNPTNVISSDDETIEDTNSLNVNVEDSSSILQVNGFEDIKNVLIENFEIPDVYLLDKLTDFTQEEMMSNTNREGVTAKRQLEKDEIPAKKVKLEAEVVNSEPIEEELDVFGIKMEAFMGPKPILITNTCDEDGVEMKLVVSTDVKDFVDVAPKNYSERVKFRTKFICDAVEKTILITDLSKLMMILNETERRSGYNVMVDRKSLNRIYANLVREGQIIIAKIIVRFHHIVRTKNLIVYPQADLKTIIASAIDQFKMSFFIYAKRKLAPKLNSMLRTAENSDILDENFPLPTATHTNVRYKYSRTIGRVYGFYPKIAKMRVLHEVLYYLVYNYTGELVKTERMPDILRRCCDTVGEQLLSECSPMYKNEISWKTFIPPLPQHKSWANGWLLICDVLLRLPLSVFVKIFNITYIIPELPKMFLSHPVRKHFLIKNLPADTRDAILSYRKYIFSIHDIFCHLCYLGVIQFGPQQLREKDQLFVYVNKRAILYDTTSSAPGYHQICKKEYPKLTYTFNSIIDLDQYWTDLYTFSMNTKLGQRASVLGKYISLENIHSKPAMMDAMRPQTSESAPENDVGYLPGDGLGACCTDSALWMHIKRNWLWLTQKSKGTKSNATNALVGIRRKHIQDLKPIKLSDYVKQNEKRPVSKQPDQAPSHAAQPRRSAKRKKPSMIIHQRKAILRKVRPRKCFVKRERIDIIDKSILASMGKSRAIFVTEEDKLIQLCKCVNDYLCPNQRKRTVTSSVVRDFIHRVLPYSRKTSAAYKRRLMQLRKSDNLQDKKQPLEFNLNSNYFTQKHFKQIRNRIRNLSNLVSEMEVSLAFLHLAYYTFKAWKNSPEELASNTNTYIDYMTETFINRLQNVEYNEDDEECVYKDPKDEEEISLDTIKSVIHSSLGCQNASQEWPYQLLKVYQSFSENLLRTALNVLRDQQLISGRKASTIHSGGREGSILMCGTSYHLSFGYTFKQITKYPQYIFSEALDYVRSIYKYCDYLKTMAKSIDKFDQGNGLGMSEIATCFNIKFCFESPYDVISLDPNIKDRRELIKELAIRYKLLMLRRSQEDNDEQVMGIEKDEQVKKLEMILENFIKAHFTNNDDERLDLENEIANDLKQIFANIDGNKMVSETNDDKKIIDETKSVVKDEDWRNKPGSSNDLEEAINTDKNVSDESVAKIVNDSVQLRPAVMNVTSLKYKKNIQELAKLPKSICISDDDDMLGVDRRFRSLRVSDLAFLLTKGLFPELDDDDRLEKLNKHFLVRYPTCKFLIDDCRFQENDHLYREIYLDIMQICKEIEKELENGCIVRNCIPDESECHDILNKLGGNDQDISSAEEILNFVHLKNILGASPNDLKENYATTKGNLELETILAALIDVGFLIRAGIYNIAFVHYNFRHHWTIYLDSSKNPRLEKDSVGFRVKVSPWIRIDGTVHISILDNWLCIILSHCLSNPFISLTSLVKRFCYIKPVDIYSILELLQKLTCIQIMAYHDVQESDLFSEIFLVEKAPAKITDDFENVFVETDKLATIKFGAFMNKDNTVFNVPFEE